MRIPKLLKSGHELAASVLNKYRSWRGISHGFLTVVPVEIGPDGTDAALAKWLVDMDTDDSQMEQILAAHNTALEIINRYNTGLEPFALYLRSFDLEMLRLPATSPLVKRVENVQVLNSAGPVERALAESLADPMSVITVAHPGNTLVRPGDVRVPRLQIFETDWRNVVMEMAVRSAMIVIEVAQISPGLQEELAALSDSDAANRCVIVLHDTDSAAMKDFEYQRRLLMDMGGIRPEEAAAPYERPTRDHPAVCPFRRIVTLNDLADSGMEHVPQFADLLHDLRYEQRLGSAGRRRRSEGLSLGGDAAMLAQDGRWGEAATMGLRALEIFADIDDAVGVIGVCTDLAFAMYAEDDAARTQQCVEWLLRSAERLTEQERTGLLYRFSVIADLQALLSHMQLTDLLERLRASFGLHD